MLKLDHIVLAAESLVEGVNYVEERLEHRLDAGGKHEMFGTHNRLLSLGDCYFEVIAKNPEASSPQVETDPRHCPRAEPEPPVNKPQSQARA